MKTDQPGTGTHVAYPQTENSENTGNPLSAYIYCIMFLLLSPHPSIQCFFTTLLTMLELAFALLCP